MIEFGVHPDVLTDQENSVSSQMFMGYWLGYEPTGNKLSEVPANVPVVALAFVLTAPGHTLTMDSLTKAHSEQEIREGVRTLKARGQKVVMSINGRDDWAGHEFGWQNLDPPLFAANVRKIVIDDWGIDGIDLDNEADYTPDAKADGNFIQVIQELRKALGPDALITLPVFMGQERDLYLNYVMKEVSSVYTMAYWNRLDGQKSLLEEYRSLVGKEKAGIGVAMKGAANPGQETDFSIVPDLAQIPDKAGMMLWHLNSPDAQTWCDSITKHLP